MNISLCITTFNEEKSIGRLLDSLLVQTKKPAEIVIVDGGSKDKTVEIIRHYQNKNSKIKLLVERCSRARGRNIGIEIAKSEIIAITDAGCTAHKDWLEKLTSPFIHPEVDISAGFYKMVPTILPSSAYKMVGETGMQKAMSIFLGVMPSKFDINFLPSTRSMAFRKRVWEEVGGFPGEERNSAEDTYFNFHALKLGLSYARVKNAVVEWGMPETIAEFRNKIYAYAKWDAKSKVWFFPGKGLTSHNIRALSVLARYVAGLTFFVLAFKFTHLFPILLILLFLYFFWSFRKVQNEFNDWRVAIWGPVLQLTSDFAVISGLISGILGR